MTDKNTISDSEESFEDCEQSICALCPRCEKRISPRRSASYPRCQSCEQSIHFQCSSLAPRTWNSLSLEIRRSWTCIDCSNLTAGTPKAKIDKRSLSASNSPETSAELVQETKKSKKSTMPEVTLEAIGSLFDQRMAELETRVIAAVRNEFETNFSNLRTKVIELEEVVVTQAKKIELLEKQLEDKDQYDRSNSLVISGIPLLPGETPNNAVPTGIKVANTLGFKLEPRDINMCHRLKSSNKDLPPLFIFKFVSRHVKYDFMKEVVKRKPTAELFGGSKNIKIYVNNQLTAKQSMFLKSVKMKIKNKGFRVNLFRGAVYVREDKENSIRIKVTTLEEVDQILLRVSNLI